MLYDIKKILKVIVLIVAIIVSFRYVPTIPLMIMAFLGMKSIYETLVTRFKGKVVNSTSQGVTTRNGGKYGKTYVVPIKCSKDKKVFVATFILRKSAEKFDEKHINPAYYYKFKKGSHLVPRANMVKELLLTGFVWIPVTVFGAVLTFSYSVDNVVGLF